MAKHKRELLSESRMTLGAQPMDEKDRTLPFKFQLLWMRAGAKGLMKERKQWPQRKEPRPWLRTLLSETHLLGRETSCLQVNIVSGTGSFSRGNLNREHLGLLPGALPHYFINKLFISSGKCGIFEATQHGTGLWIIPRDTLRWKKKEGEKNQHNYQRNGCQYTHLTYKSEPHYSNPRISMILDDFWSKTTEIQCEGLNAELEMVKILKRSLNMMLDV